MTLEKTIEELKSRKRVKIQKQKNPTYNRMLISHDMSKDFLNEIRKKEELGDIKSLHFPEGGLDLKVKLDRSLPANSVIFMQDLDPVAAWIGGELKLITKKI